MTRMEEDNVTIHATKVVREILAGLEAGADCISAQGGARSGKTYNIMIFLISKAFEVPGLTISVVRATRPAIKSTCLRDFEDIMKRYGFFEEKCFNRTDLVYRFDNGSIMEFFGTESDQKVRGGKRDILFCNEANELKESVFRQLKMRTTTLTILDYNPSFDEDHWINGINLDSRTHHFVTTYLDNHYLPTAIVREIESYKQTNPSLWKVFGLGEQAAVIGRIYDFEIIDYLPDVSSCVEAYGLDWGFSQDKTAIVDTFVDTRQNILYVHEVLYENGLTNPEIADRMERAGIPKRSTPIYADCASPKDIEEIYQFGFNIKPCIKGKTKASALNFMQRYKIFITRESTNLIKELQRYTWEIDKNGKPTNQPVGTNDHLADSMLYAVYSSQYNTGDGVYCISFHTPGKRIRKSGIRWI